MPLCKWALSSLLWQNLWANCHGVADFSGVGPV